MKRTLLGLTLALSALPVSALADCLSGSDFAKNSTVTLYEQVSLVKNKFQTGELTAEIRIPDTISTMTRA